MAQFIEVPPGRLEVDVLQSLLEEYANREGTDYGFIELTQAEKVARLQQQIDGAELLILWDLDSEQWDLLPSVQAKLLLNS